MKKLFSSLFFASILLLSGCEKEQSYSGQVQGNARLKQEFLYNTDSQTMIGIIKEYEYNDQGKLSRTSTPMYENGSMTGTISYNLYDYDSYGRLAKITNYNANINSPTGFINLSNLIYEYSDNGLKTKESVEYPASGIKEYTNYEYSDGRMSVSKKYANNKLESYILYQYDNAGRLTKELNYASDGQCLSYTIHTYSGSLQVKSDFYTYSNKVLYRSVTRTYDEGNNLINLESKEIVPSSSQMSYVMKYIYYQ